MRITTLPDMFTSKVEVAILSSSKNHHHALVFASRLFFMICDWYTMTGIRKIKASIPK